MMKNVLCMMFVLGVVFMANVSLAGEDEYFFPKENPIFSLSLPDDWMMMSSGLPDGWREWKKENVEGAGVVPFQASPDFMQEGRLLLTLVAFVPDAVADLEAAEQNAGELIAERFADFTPAAEAWQKMTINDIPFTVMEATGKEIIRDGAPVNISAAFFNPEGTHVFLLLMTGSPDVLKQYEKERQKVLHSIKPGK